MKTLVDQLSNYAAYHRDRRNILTHLVGVPMIVFAVMVLLSRPALASAGPLPVTPALALAALTVLYYMRLQLALGILMGVLFAAGLYGAAQLAGGTDSSWVAWGAGLFVVGWIIQAIGHVYEGRKPAFFDDVIGLIVGPLFVVCELLFHIGLARDAQRQIEQRAGPTLIRPRGRAAAR